jgi:hypothetical protein
MIANLGTTDRVFRALPGLLVLAAPVASGVSMFASSAATMISVIAGIVLSAMSAMKFCPLYRIPCIRTCKT